MKKNIIVVILLMGLFVFGLLIYNFSDEVDKILSNNEWYLVENGNANVMSFRNNKFYYKDFNNGKSIDLYKDCKNYLYNSNINVIKLDCSIDDNKIYINNISNDILNITINNENKILYSSLDSAYVTDFKTNNNLSDKEYNELININLDEYSFISVSDIIKKYNSKSYGYVAFVNTDISYANIYNYKELDKLLVNKDIKLLNTNILTTNNKKKLNNISKKYFNSKEDFIKDEIIIYKIGKKSVNVDKILDINTINS